MLVDPCSSCATFQLQPPLGCRHADESGGGIGLQGLLSLSLASCCSRPLRDSAGCWHASCEILSFRGAAGGTRRICHGLGAGSVSMLVAGARVVRLVPPLSDMTGSPWPS